MPAPKEILDLIDRFHRNKDAYKSGDYNETQLRREFLDAFFTALGWDVENKQGFAEAYKDVVHEDAIKIGTASKAPDYSFRVGGIRKFFVEAKKPSVNLKDDVSPAFQLRRYAWSAKLPLSILTDFEEFVVYDCRVKPLRNDKPSTARTIYLQYTDYDKQWVEIASIFSKDSVLKGSFDKYAETNKIKKGTAQVDDAFLREIENWRKQLASNIALRNGKLTQRELNFSVQRTIDRIIFLRICEDRGIEHYGALMALLNGERVYRRLSDLFHRADERYNSGLFHFRREKERFEPPDELTLELSIDDKPLKEIISTLYYPESPYEFSVLPADILGQVYEQFLGKVIRLTEGHRAIVEDKPEVKKAGGVYYTPTYIVEYIVKNTVGKLLEGLTPKQASKLRILDPACGSGSFLIGAYHFLLNWHRDWYVKDRNEKWTKGKNPVIYQVQGGGWRLTTTERKRILLNNIYGVDIDTQAVEVTKLSLLLKVLEGENEQTISNQIKLFHQRALPDLGKNIKCGNSLIGPDYYAGEQLSFGTDEERMRINAFDWKTEFKEIMDAGGFDAVIGNPPWGVPFTEQELEYLRRKNHQIIVRMIDSFMYFVFQSSKKLKKNGIFGMILPDVILYQIDNEALRLYLVDHFQIFDVINMGDVFEKVTRPACILCFKVGKNLKQLIQTADLTNLPKLLKQVELSNNESYSSLSQTSIRLIPGHIFPTSNLHHYRIWHRVNAMPHQTLEQIVDDDGIQRGVSPDFKEAFLVNAKTAKKWRLEQEKLRDVLTGGKHVKKYFIERPDLLLIYTNRNDDFRKLPNICSYIDQFKKKITCKEVVQRKHPLYALHRSREEKIFLKTPKVLGVITEDEIVTAIDNGSTFVTDGLYVFGVREAHDIRYVIGILNSKLFAFVYRLLALESGRVLAQVKPTILAQLPIRSINLSERTEKHLHDTLVMLVRQISESTKSIYLAKTDHEKAALQRQIDATDKQIDRLVYELYGLTEEEIKIVEGGTK